MPNTKTAKPDKAQSLQFKKAARALECDEDENRFDAALKRVAQHKPAPPAKRTTKKHGY